MQNQFKIEPAHDLIYKPNFQVNSWFAVGHFEDQNETISYLFHLMAQKTEQGPILNANFSVTNETTGYYHAEDKIIPLANGTIATDKFLVQAPIGTMFGDEKEIKVKVRTSEVTLDVTFKSVGDIIYNAGSGQFPIFLGGNIQQYSLPNLTTTGFLSIKGKKYTISGVSWFDRQWQFSPQEVATTLHMHTDWNWLWMDLHLDNGKVISLWNFNDKKNDAQNAWVTILNQDKTQEVVTIAPLTADKATTWNSSVTDQHYPTRWTINIPEKAAKLEVTTDIPQQEIVSQSSFLNKYEAASKISGTYDDQTVSGYTYVELLGEWN